jgi:DNA-binding MarR family transcriptional regulator
MVDVGLKFLRPTKIMRELFVLLSLEETQKLSQHQLARKIGVSSSMAHNYMKTLMDQGLVTASGQTNRCMRYAVTSRGNDRKALLMSGYSKEIARLYSIAKQEVEHRLRELFAQGLKTVVLFGAAETGELVLSASKTTPMRIVGWVDNDVTKHGKRFGEHQISSPDLIETVRPDGVVIASSGKTEEIHHQLRHLAEKGITVATL